MSKARFESLPKRAGPARWAALWLRIFAFLVPLLAFEGRSMAALADATEAIARAKAEGRPVIAIYRATDAGQLSEGEFFRWAKAQGYTPAINVVFDDEVQRLARMGVDPKVARRFVTWPGVKANVETIERLAKEGAVFIWGSGPSIEPQNRFAKSFGTFQNTSGLPSVYREEARAALKTTGGKRVGFVPGPPSELGGVKINSPANLAVWEANKYVPPPPPPLDPDVAAAIEDLFEKDEIKPPSQDWRGAGKPRAGWRGAAKPARQPIDWGAKWAAGRRAAGALGRGIAAAATYELFPSNFRSGWRLTIASLAVGIASGFAIDMVGRHYGLNSDQRFVAGLLGGAAIDIGFGAAAAYASGGSISAGAGTAAAGALWAAPVAVGIYLSSEIYDGYAQVKAMGGRYEDLLPQDRQGINGFFSSWVYRGLDVTLGEYVPDWVP